MCLLLIKEITNLPLDKKREKNETSHNTHHADKFFSRPLKQKQVWVAEINKNNLRHLLDFSTKSRNNNPLNYITRRVKFKTLEILRNKNAARKGNLGKFFRNRYTSNYYSTPPFFFYFTIFRSFFFFFYVSTKYFFIPGHQFSINSRGKRWRWDHHLVSFVKIKQKENGKRTKSSHQTTIVIVESSLACRDYSTAAVIITLHIPASKPVLIYFLPALSWNQTKAKCKAGEDVCKSHIHRHTESEPTLTKGNNVQCNSPNDVLSRAIND